MNSVTFNQRFGIHANKIIENDFPEKARIGLLYILEDITNQEFIRSENNNPWGSLFIELERISKVEFKIINNNDSYIEVVKCVNSTEWFNLYIFCERIYSKLLIEKESYNSFQEEYYLEKSLKDVKQYYSDEINNLMKEENIGFQFVDGIFIRIGKAQTQKNINKATAVLIDPKLNNVKHHYNKALKFFNSKNNPDYQNCIKESLCALEACAEICSNIKISKDFSKEIRKLEGNSSSKIPPPIIQSMIKLFAYRGTASGVSHGNTDGLRVGRLEAELILSIVASYITYIVEFFDNLEEEIPF